MIFAALSEAAERGELLLAEGGLCRWHRRRDSVVVIREILVLPDYRRRGIGRGLVARVMRQTRGPVVARCPARYDANLFWHALGFSLVSCEAGVNLWHYPRPSSTAGTVTPPSPPPP